MSTAGVFLDEGLAGQYQQGLHGGPLSADSLGLFLSNVTPAKSSVFTDFNLDPGTRLVVATGWSYSLNSLAHLLTCTQNVSFVFSGLSAGTTYYGALLYSHSTSKGFWAVRFPVTYVVPVGPANLIVSPSLTFGEC